MSRPGEVAGLPKLVLRYPTDPDAHRRPAAAGPGHRRRARSCRSASTACRCTASPSTASAPRCPPASTGIDGQYSLGIGIDQESAIFGSRETNGQPKFPCSVRFFRLGDEVEASATHQGYTFLTYRGTVTGHRRARRRRGRGQRVVDQGRRGPSAARRRPTTSRRTSCGCAPRAIATHAETLDGELDAARQPWDPLHRAAADASAPATAELVTTRHTAREITLDGPLDPDALLAASPTPSAGPAGPASAARRGAAMSATRP